MRMREGAMRGIVQEGCGWAGVPELGEIDTPTIDDDSLLVRVRASSVNRSDMYSILGVPRLVTLLMTRSWKQPDPGTPGTDVAGVVEAGGKNVTAFRPGDAVFSARSRAYADFGRAAEKSGCAPQPE